MPSMGRMDSSTRCRVFNGEFAKGNELRESESFPACSHNAASLDLFLTHRCQSHTDNTAYPAFDALGH